MTKEELIIEFSKLDDYGAFSVLIDLLKLGKLDYTLLSQAYVKYLQDKYGYNEAEAKELSMYGMRYG